MLKRVNADELATAPAAAPRLSRGDVPAGEPRRTGRRIADFGLLNLASFFDGVRLG